MRTLLVMAVLSGACGSSTAQEEPTAPSAPSVVAPESAVESFTIVENGRAVIAPAVDGSFTVDGPTRFVVAADGTLTKGGALLLAWSGTSLRTADGAEVAHATAAGLRFGDRGELTLAADGTVSAVGGDPGGETFQVKGLTAGNRRAALTVLAWLMVDAAPPASAGAPAEATEEDCRRLVDHAVKLGVMQAPDGKKGPPPPEVRDALAKQCAESGMEAEAIRCFTAATDAQQWADCDKKH